MRSDSHRLDDLVDAILDGAPVDWTSAESTADLPNRRLRFLRTVAKLADVHRRGGAHPGQWGHLQIQERVGGGAYGDVYRAWDTRLQREVALKLIPVDSAASSIIDEGRRLARVQHSNVVTIYGADEIDGHVGLWMELIRGRTLEQLLKAGKRFEPNEVLRIGLQLGRAVAAVHAAGLLHRDIKAQNVMQADDGRIVLMDFGAGRDAGLHGSDLTGTPLYLAPEVFQGQPATVQSDIYSLGVLLYYLLAAAYPVRGKTIEDVRAAHLASVRFDVREIRADVPPSLVRLIERATDPRPEQRYASADDLSAAFVKSVRASSRGRWLMSTAAVGVAMAGGLVLAQREGWITVPARVNAALSSTFGVSPTAVLSRGERPVIAVLPFTYHGGDPEGELIADGLGFEVIRNLKMLDGLDVISVSAVPGSVRIPGDPQTVGRQLSANLVLTASLFAWPGEAPHVDAQLVRIADNAIIWVHRFGAPEASTVQSQMSRMLTNWLRLRGIGQRRYQLDPALNLKFLHARGLQVKRQQQFSLQAADLFEEIIKAEPSFAPAYAGLASSLSQILSASQEAVMQPPDPRMEPAARTAIDLDPFLAEAHAAKGAVVAFHHDWDQARALYSKAIEMDPRLTSAYGEFVVMVHMPLGLIDEGRRLLEEACRLNPESLDARRVLSYMELQGGLYDRAIANARWVVSRDPDFPHAKTTLLRALYLAGRTEEAADLVLRQSGRYGEALGYFHAVTGDRTKALAFVATLQDRPAMQAVVYAGLRDRDRALDALERTADIHWWRAATWSWMPEFAFLHGDPRFIALQKRLGIVK